MALLYQKCYEKENKLNFVLFSLITIALSAFGGATIGNLEQVVYDDVPLEDNGWGPQQDHTQPYCGKTRVYILKLVENGTVTNYDNYTWTRLCNI